MLQKPVYAGGHEGFQRHDGKGSGGEYLSQACAFADSAARRGRTRPLCGCPLSANPCRSPKLCYFEINDIAALLPLFCYNSYPCFALSACASERWFAKAKH